MNIFEFSFEDNGRNISGLFVDKPGYMSYADVANLLYYTHRSHLTLIGFVIVRDSISSEFVFPKKFEVNSLLRRIPTLPLFLLGSNDFRHVLSKNLNTRVRSPFRSNATPRILKALRQQELLYHAKNARAVLKTTESRIFRAPSRKLTTAFLRVGNVQINRATLDSFFFWLLPWLKECHYIIAETWTISSIALNAARLASRYAPGSHMMIEVDMLSRYHEAQLDRDKEVELALTRAYKSGSKNVLILVSSSMTGRVVKEIQRTLTRVNLPLERFLFAALYRLGANSNVECLCDLSTGAAGVIFANIDKAPKGASIIEIDPITYFPAQAKTFPVEVLKETTNKSSKIFTEYRGKGLFCVHKDSAPIRGHPFRHHAIYLDVAAVLNKSPFWERFQYRLAEIGVCPRVILSPPHHAGKAMGEFAQKYFRRRFNQEVPCFQHLNLQFSSESKDNEENKLAECLRKVSSPQCILIIDDVSITGARLFRYQLSLRMLNFTGRIHFLVGFARPADTADWNARERLLCFRENHREQHTVRHVEFLTLPDWTKSDCPWCIEQELYRTLSSRKRVLPKFLVNRALQLQTTHLKSMTDDLFLIFSQSQPFNLTHNSIFLPKPASQADVYCAVSSAIQELRSNPTNKNYLHTTFPEMRVLAKNHYLGHHFSDSVIRAAVLRACMPSELEYYEDEINQQRHKMAVDIILNNLPDENNLAAELILASIQLKLPSSVLKDSRLRTQSNPELEEFLSLVSNL